MRPLAHAFCGEISPQRRQAQNAAASGLLRSWVGSLPVPASDSGESEKRYCCAGGETPHKRPAKLAAFPRKAGGSKRPRRATLLRTLAKAESAHQRATLNVQVKEARRLPEFADQARIFLAMENLFGEQARAELKAFVNGSPVRFDVAIVCDGRVQFAVEVKQKQRVRWRKNWLSTRQGRTYAAAKIPVYIVCGSEEARAFIDSLSCLPVRHGVIWSDEWHRKLGGRVDHLHRPADSA